MVFNVKAMPADNARVARVRLRATSSAREGLHGIMVVRTWAKGVQASFEDVHLTLTVIKRADQGAMAVEKFRD